MIMSTRWLIALRSCMNTKIHCLANWYIQSELPSTMEVNASQTDLSKSSHPSSAMVIYSWKLMKHERFALKYNLMKKLNSNIKWIENDWFKRCYCFFLWMKISFQFSSICKSSKWCIFVVWFNITCTFLILYRDLFVFLFQIETRVQTVSVEMQITVITLQFCVLFMPVHWTYENVSISIKSAAILDAERSTEIYLHKHWQ